MTESLSVERSVNVAQQINSLMVKYNFKLEDRFNIYGMAICLGLGEIIKKEDREHIINKLMGNFKNIMKMMDEEEEKCDV